MAEGTKERKQKMREKFESNNAWMKDISKGDIEQIKEDFQRLVTKGFPGREMRQDGAVDSEQ